MSLEIERKYLVEMPNISNLRTITEVKESRIIQTYLTSPEGMERRVRSRLYPDGSAELFYTEKSSIKSSNGLTREEKEREISSQEYQQLLKEADNSLNSIVKTRYVFEYEGLTFELDAYEFEKNYATMEVELESEETVITLPPYIKAIRDVTSDKRFKNKSLAKSQALPK